MKKVSLFLIFMFAPFGSNFSHLNFYRNNGIVEFILDYEDNEFNIHGKWPGLSYFFDCFEQQDNYIYNSDVHSEPIVFEDPNSNGTFKINNNEITCYDSKLNRINKFIFIDKYTIISTKQLRSSKKANC